MAFIIGKRYSIIKGQNSSADAGLQKRSLGLRRGRVGFRDKDVVTNLAGVPNQYCD